MSSTEAGKPKLVVVWGGQVSWNRSRAACPQWESLRLDVGPGLFFLQEVVV